MKKMSKFCLSCITLAACLMVLCSFDSPNGTNSYAATRTQPPRIGIVNFKHCVEQSKIGKQEQASFEGLKKQMENVLSEKEKNLNDMAIKFEDPDYLDSLSPEAETDLKRNFRAQNQELAQLQNQYMQSLQQTNIKVIQKLNDMVTQAAANVAKSENFDLILNEEAAFFYSPELDLSDKVILLLDQEFEKMPKEAKEKAATALEQLR